MDVLENFFFSGESPIPQTLRPLRLDWMRSKEKLFRPDSYDNIGAMTNLMAKRNTWLMPDVQHDLAVHWNKTVAFCLSMMLHLTPEVIDILGRRDLSSVRMNIAARKDIELELLELLSDDKVTDVRKQVAINDITPIHILDKLSHDKNTRVRKCVAGNKHTTVDILHRLSTDTNRDVRIKIVNNPNTSGATLDAMVETSSTRATLLKLQQCGKLSLTTQMFLDLSL